MLDNSHRSLQHIQKHTVRLENKTCAVKTCLVSDVLLAMLQKLGLMLTFQKEKYILKSTKQEGETVPMHLEHYGCNHAAF